MRKYFNEASARQIGERIRTSRKDHGYSLEDISAMTGFSVNTISSIENGGDTYISYVIAVCPALSMRPSDLLDINLNLKPRFELPPERRNRSLTTLRVNQLYETGFFSSAKFVGSVLKEFVESYGIQPHSFEISTALKKLTTDGKLEFTKEGRTNLYVKKS